MGKKYQNINDHTEPELKKKKRMTLNPFENMYRKDGKGVEKDEVKVLDKPGIANFFKLLRRRLNHIFSVNLLLIFGNFPIFFALFALAYTTADAVAPSSQMFPLISGAAAFDQGPAVTTLLGVFGKIKSVSIFSTSTYVFLGLALLFVFTFGLVNIGTTYILRNIIKGEPVFIMSDFKYAIKRNLKQGIIFGIIDVLMIVILLYDFMYYRLNAGFSGLFSTMYVVGFGMLILYFFARMYAYLMIITFDMKITKVLKNCIYFSVLGFKRNIMMLIGTVAIVYLNLVLFYVFVPIGIIIPFIILFGFIQYMSVYCAYPKIKQIMIDPYYKEVEAEEAEA